VKRWIVCLVLLAVPVLLFATTVVPMGVEALTRASSHVVEARATGSTSQWNPEHTFIFTYTRFEVTRTLKGQASKEILVRQIGGTVEGTTQKVAGVRQWRSGDEAVLFLQPSPVADGTLIVTGLMQGNFLMRRTQAGRTYVSNGMPEAFEYQAAAGGVTSYRGNTMRLDEIESRVQKAVQK
jgi:hypothetical protein